ncbi:MAG: branched-chain amino acid ABC transporter permease [bacterium]
MDEYPLWLETFLQTLTTGILVGGTYALMCVGLGLIFGVMRVINFAQGDFLMLGMYASLYVFTFLGVGSLFGVYAGPVVSAFLAGPIVFAVAWLIHYFLLSRVSGTAAKGAEAEGHYAQLVMTLGISLVLQNGGLIVFGSWPQSVRTPLSREAWFVEMVFFNKSRVVAFFVAIGLALVLYWFMNRSNHGKALRAAADNPDAATYMGIDVNRAHRLAFSIGIALTAIAGGLVAMYYPFQPYVGLDFVIIMYAGVVLGGLGSILGAFWGGMTIGLVQQLSILILPFQLQNAAIFIVFLLIILFRPQGLFGRSVERT